MQLSIFFSPVELMGEFYVRDTVEVATANRAAYTAGPSFAVIPTDDVLDAVEEAFDLSNNPSRQAERVMVYGRGRSVSVGDIVQLENGSEYVCGNFGWTKLETLVIA